MGEPWQNAGGLSFPWRQNADLTWSYAPDADGVRLSAETPDDTDPWHVTPAEAEALAESDEWSAYVRQEVDHYLSLLDGLG